MWCKATITDDNSNKHPNNVAIRLLTKRSISKGIIKDVILIWMGVLLVWLALVLVFGAYNPFYIVASGSMIPVLEVNDVLVVQAHEPFESIKRGDIIVFDRPSDHNRVIVHRVLSIISEEPPRTIKTKGDANPGPIPGTDFPITEKEYIGKVVYVIPQIGYATQLLKPPINYIIIAIVISIMIIKQMRIYKNANNDGDDDGHIPSPSRDIPGDPDMAGKIPDMDMMPKDDKYAKYAKDTTTKEESDDAQKHDNDSGDKKGHPK